MAALLLYAATFAAAAGPGISIPSGLEERFWSPAGIEWGFFRNDDGARIRYCHVAPAGPARGAAVLVTGYSEHAEKYFELMRELAARGYAVWEMDWRGHGGSDRYLKDREKAYSLGFARDIQDLDRFVRDFVRAEPGKPLFLVSHSMGGNISLRYLHDHPGRFAFAVISAPALSVDAKSRRSLPEWAVRGLVWANCAFGLDTTWAVGEGPWRDQPWPQTTHDLVRREVQRAWFRANPQLRIGGVTGGWLREFLRSCDVLARPRYLSAIRTPLLLGSALQDSWTRPDVQLRACSQMPGCKLQKFDGAWHELFMEAEAFRRPWLNALFAFAEAHPGK
jgi:lysophospholipase